MKRSSLLMFLVCAMALLFGVASLVQADWDPDVDSHKMHYPQLPDLTVNGMDVLAGPLSYGDDPTQVYEKFLADDWTCSATGPVTEIHIWGSYNYDIVLTDMPSFSLVIYEDIPADPDVIGSYSRPGAVLWERYMQPTAVRLLPVQVVEQFYDPNPGEIIGMDTQVWQYNFEIPESEAFMQDEGTVYWLGIHYSFDLNPDGVVDVQDFMVLLQSYPGVFGWKTSGVQHHLDDAVWTDVMTFGGPPHVVPPASTQWRELRYPANHEMAGMSIDLAFVINGPEQEPEEYSKWIQRPHGPEQGFDEASNIWIHEETEIIKWEQLPDGQTSGLHSHDWQDAAGGAVQWVKCADDFMCQGGDITDVHWWGNYENNNPAGGIAFFHLSLHRCDLQPPPPALWHLPLEPEVWGWDVPFAMCNQTDTGMVNNMGETIYSYKVDLPDPYPQIEGEWYWLDVMAKSNDPVDAAIWRWQEARRGPAPPMGHAPAAQRSDSSPWTSIIWSGDPERYSDMAFAITSQDSTTVPEVNKVVADDFVSDGRVIKKVRWWGSYFDDRYDPFIDPIEPYVIDGWIVSFHHTRGDDGTNLACPPDIMAGSVHPTALGLYFVKAGDLEIIPTGIWDCHGHNVYEYKVDLSQCHLICQEVDPRSGTTPAQPGAFYEEECFGYWLDIVAVVGAIWDNGDIIYTGHIPSDMTADGRFWGWHTSPDANLKQACSGQIVDMTPPTPFCWDYGNWYKVPWQCPTPVTPPVNMSFELITPEEEPATCFVGTQAQFAVWCGWGQPQNWCGDCWFQGDIDCDCAITFADVQIAYGDFLDPTSPQALTGRSDVDMDGAITFADVQIVYGAFLPPTVLCPVPCTPGCP